MLKVYFLKLLVVGFAGSVFAAGCGDATQNTPTECPSTLVMLDAGTDAFANTGEYASDSRCAKFCDAEHPVCELVNGTTVKCMKGCS